jgi:hypothetical protein
MPAPFTCPHCGSHDYSVVLTGCQISGGVLQESFEWDEDAGLYGSSGTVLVETEAIEHADASAICNACEKDVSEAVSKFEESFADQASEDTAQA